MSLLSEDGISESEFKSVGGGIREWIVRKGAKIKARELLAVQDMFRRDHRQAARLNDAVHQELMGVAKSDEEEDGTVLADNITVTRGAGAVAASVATGGLMLGALTLGALAVKYLKDDPTQQPPPQQVEQVERPDADTRNTIRFID